MKLELTPILLFGEKTSKSDEPFKIIWIGKFDFRKQFQ